VYTPDGKAHSSASLQRRETSGFLLTSSRSVGERKFLLEGERRRWIVRAFGGNVWERWVSSCGSFMVATEPVVARRRCFLESWWLEARNGVSGVTDGMAILGLLVVGVLLCVVMTVVLSVVAVGWWGGGVVDVSSWRDRDRVGLCSRMPG